MVWMLGGYMWLFVHRPFEVWPWLGDFQIERIYMLLMIAFWAVQPNKGWLSNRLHVAARRLHARSDDGVGGQSLHVLSRMSGIGRGLPQGRRILHPGCHQRAR